MNSRCSWIVSVAVKVFETLLPHVDSGGQHSKDKYRNKEEGAVPNGPPEAILME